MVLDVRHKKRLDNRDYVYSPRTGRAYRAIPAVTRGFVLIFVFFSEGPPYLVALNGKQVEPSISQAPMGLQLSQYLS